MARLKSFGFETGSATALVEVTSFVINGGSVTNTVARSGTYSFRSLNTGATATSFCRMNFAAANANGPFFARAYIRLDDAPAAITNIFMFGDGSAVIAGIRLATNATFELWDTAKIGSSSSAITVNDGAWHLLELKYFNNTGTTKGEFDARLDGVSFSSTTAAAAPGGVVRVVIGVNTTTTSYDMYFDDCAVNDSTGSSQTSFPGSGSIVHIHPDSAGDNNAFTVQVGGTAGAANNFTRVLEVTPNDATDYNADVLSGTIDDFNMDATPASINSSATINVVEVHSRFAGALTINEAAFKVRIKSASGGTVSEGTAVTPTATTWSSDDVSTPQLPTLVLYNDPDGNAWKKGTLDTAQVGYRISTTNTNAAQISTVWTLIDYTAGTGSISLPILGAG